MVSPPGPSDSKPKYKVGKILLFDFKKKHNVYRWTVKCRFAIRSLKIHTYFYLQNNIAINLYNNNLNYLYLNLFTYL